MGLLGYDKITITDLMDAVPASLTFTSNINSEVQKKQGNSYEPNLEEGEGLIITPSFFIGNEEISLEKITEELMGGSNQENHCGIFVVYQIGDDSYSYNEDVSIDSSKIYVDIDNKLHYKQNLENSITIKGYIEKYEDISTGSTYANIKVSNPITINFITFESGYSAFIENNGRNHFDENNTSSITLKAVLYYGTEEYSDIKSYEWKQVGKEGILSDKPEISIDRNSIGAFDKFICTITTEEGLIFKVSENIYDRTDGYQSRIVAYDSLIFTPKHTVIELENQVWYGTSQLNKNDSDRFEYSWFYFSKEKEEEEEEEVLKKNILSSSNYKVLSLDNSDLPKENFTLYCQTLIDKKTTVLSEIDIKYSAINYEVQITPKTVYVSTNNEGTYRGEGTFSKTINFKIIDLDTGALVPFKGGEEETKPTFSLEDSSPFLITIDENNNEWNFNITISEKSIGAINKNSFSNDLTISFKYKYLEVEYENQIELIENRSGEVGQPGYSIDLTNSFHSFGGTATAANQGESTEFGIQAYYGDADLNITKITIVDGEEEIQIYSDTTSDKSSIYYPSGNPCLRIDYERKNIIKEEEVEGEKTYLSSEGLFTLTTGPFGEEKPDSSFLQKGGKITLKISVSADNLITRTFTRDFGYNINYDNNSYYLAFPNGNSIVYLPSKNSYNPDTLTVVANQKNSDDVISSYNGVIWYALDDGKTNLNWIRLTSNLELKNISPSTKRIQFELYSTNSSTDDYPKGKDLLDLEDIPILHSLEGTEIGGENLLLWTKEFPIESDKWSTVEAIVIKTENGSSEQITVVPSIETQEEEECFILKYDKNILNKNEDEEAEENENINNIEENISPYSIYSTFNKAEMKSPFSRYLQEYNEKNFIFSYHYLESYKADYEFILTVYDSTKEEIGSYSLKESLSEGSEDQFIEGAVWEKEKILFNFSQINFKEGKTREAISYFTISFKGILTEEDNKLLKKELISFKKMKIELGSIATDWRESPYDVEYKDLIPANLISYKDSYYIEIKDGESKEFKIPAEYLQDYCVSWANVEDDTEKTRTKWTLKIIGRAIEKEYTLNDEKELIETIYEKEESLVENDYDIGTSSFYSFNNNKTIQYKTGSLKIPFTELIFKFSLPKPEGLEENNNYLIKIHQLKIEKNSKPTGYFLGDDFIEQLAKKFGDDSIVVEELKTNFDNFSSKKYLEVSEANARIKAVAKHYLAEYSPSENDDPYGLSKDEDFNNYFSQIQKGVEIVAESEDNQEPFIRISTTKLKNGETTTINAIKITDKKISFEKENEEIAYIEGEKMFIKQAHLAETFIIGEEYTSGELVVSITPTGVGFKWGKFSKKEEEEK